MLLPSVAVVFASVAVAVRSSGYHNSSSISIQVDLNEKYQSVDGFGISAAFQRAYLIQNLTADGQQYVLDLLFDTERGAGFTILRNGIGSSNSSQKDFMNTILPVSPGSPDATPNYVWDRKDSGQLWLSQQAQKYGVKTFYADAWSAPGFMKNNSDDANGGTLCGFLGQDCASGDWRQTYADYLAQYIQFYAQEGVPLTHVGFLNEPDLTTSYASMRSTGPQAADFIRILRQTLNNMSLQSVGIVCCEATGWPYAQQYARDIIAAGAESDVAVFSGHEYRGRVNSSIATSQHVWQSEYSDLSGVWNTSWYTTGATGDGLVWANTLHTGMTTGNLNGYLWWEGVQGPDPNTNEKLIRIDGQNITVSKRLWAFAQWSRFVRPGATRVGTTVGTGAQVGFKTSAFVNADGTVAVQVINNNTAAVDVGVKFAGGQQLGSVTAWLTDEANDLNSTAVSVQDCIAAGSVPARSMVTFLIKS